MGKLRKNKIAAQVMVCTRSARARLVETQELLKVE
jgi:hypothetical protein